MTSPSRRGPWLRGLAAAAVAAGLVGAFFLSRYPGEGLREPLGWDTARYLWRNGCVAAGGLEGLERCVPPLSGSLPGRVAYPMVTLPLSSALGATDRVLAAVLPAVAAAAIGLGAGALASGTTAGGPVALAVVAVVVGTSGMVVRLAAPESYADNMISVALAVAGLSCAAAFVLRGRGGVGAALLLAAAAVAHWPGFLVIAAAVAVAAAVQVPAARGELRAGVSLVATAPVRLAGVLAGAGMGWAAALGAVGAAPERFFADPLSIGNKVRADLAAYALPVTLPAAAAGGVALGRGQGEARGRGFLEILLASWLGVVAGATALWLVDRTPPFLGSGFALHRILMLAIPIPILAGLGILWAAGAAGRVARPLAAAVLAVGVAGLALLGYRQWSRAAPYLDPGRLREAAAVSAYLERSVPQGRTVVVVVDGVGENPETDLYQVADTLRVPLSPERIPDLWLYLGRSELLEAGLPTLTGSDPAYDRASLARWTPLEALVRGEYVALALRSTTPEYRELAAEARERVVAPGVLVSRGPLPAEPVPAPPAPAPLTAARLGLTAAGALILLGLAGIGWALALVGGGLSPAGVVAVSPGFGLAALLAAGLAADALGIRLTGSAGAGVLVGAAMVGLAVARRYPPRRQSDAPSDPDRAAVNGP